MATAVIVLTAAMIATAMDGRLASGSPDRVIDGFSIDTRTLQPGDLFFAIVADRDGHDFVPEAFRRGAAGAVVTAGFEAGSSLATSLPGSQLPEGGVVIHVSDTTVALQNLARFVRQESATKVVAITGSAGKTTTKEAIAELLSGQYRVTRNTGNLNNHLGLPLSLLELRHGADVAVMELGMSHAGEIRLLVDIADPEVRVWTNVGDAHLGHFESQDAIAAAKGEILEAASAVDVLVANADDRLIMERAPSFAGRLVTFGVSPDADVRADEIYNAGLAGTRFTLRWKDASIELRIPLLGMGNVSNVLAAAAVAIELDVELPEIAERAARLLPATHRGAVLRLRRGITVIDDSYNSSPAALKRALEILGNERGARRRAAVLGEMLELGNHSVRLHQECGRLAAAANLDRLVVVGDAPARALADAASSSGIPAERVTWTASSATAADLILPWLESGDVVLVKGSRGIRTEIVVDRISEEFS